MWLFNDDADLKFIKVMQIYKTYKIYEKNRFVNQ